MESDKKTVTQLAPDLGLAPCTFWSAVFGEKPDYASAEGSILTNPTSEKVLKQLKEIQDDFLWFLKLWKTYLNKRVGCQWVHFKWKINIPWFISVLVTQLECWYFLNILHKQVPFNKLGEFFEQSKMNFFLINVNSALFGIGLELKLV